MKRLTHLSLFSGIGGLDLAAEWAGFETVGQCEWAAYPTKVLEKHWPNVPRWRDIRTLTKESFYERTGLRTVDIISGGFPCQPFSVAGKRAGTSDDRYLWPEMLRVIRELRPTWVIGENVPGIIDLALEEVLSSLEAEGYEAQTFIIPACGVDAPHKRNRCAIVAHCNNRCGSVRRERELQNTCEAARAGRYHRRRAQEPVTGKWRENKSGVLGVVNGVRGSVYSACSDTGRKRLQRSMSGSLLDSEFTNCSCRERERVRYRGQLAELVEVTPYGKLGPMTPEWVEWLMGFPIGWTELSASETR